MEFSITLVIVAITSLISYQAFSNHELKQNLLFHPVTIKGNNDWFRFLSSGFIHGDMMHLVVNMYVLYQFGSMIETNFILDLGLGTGRIAYVLLYLGAIILSSVPSYFKHQDNPSYGALGASGGTSAVVFAWVLYGPWAWFIFPPLPGIIMAVGYLFYSSYMSKKGGDNIGHDAHFWGAVFGLVFTLVTMGALAPEVLESMFKALLKGPKMPDF